MNLNCILTEILAAFRSFDLFLAGKKLVIRSFSWLNFDYNQSRDEFDILKIVFDFDPNFRFASDYELELSNFYLMATFILLSPYSRSSIG